MQLSQLLIKQYLNLFFEMLFEYVLICRTCLRHMAKANKVGFISASILCGQT